MVLATSKIVQLVVVIAAGLAGPPEHKDDKLRDLADGKWHAGLEAEAAAKAGDVGVAGGGGTTDLVKKGYSSYVLTDAGVSATATVTVVRAQPYSIE